MRSNRAARLPVLAARQDLTDDRRSGSTSSSCAAAWISRARMDVPAAPRTLMAVSSTGLGPGGTGRARAGATLARATNRAWRAATFLSFAGSSWFESAPFSSTKKCDFVGTFKTWFSPASKRPCKWRTCPHVFPLSYRESGFDRRFCGVGGFWFECLDASLEFRPCLRFDGLFCCIAKHATEHRC